MDSKGSLENGICMAGLSCSDTGGKGEGMRKNTTLVIMAAGIGNRFGEGIKQLTPFGPSGEIIMDYSIHDAIEAGFDQVVFVTRKEIYQDFKEIIGDRVAKIIPVSYAFQDMSDLPSGYTVPEGRKKPWGTGQAILACKDIVKNPFAVLNADDYYGKDAFHKVHEYLVNQEETTDGKYHFCMAGFVLKNTLSDHGGVTRGICRVSPSGELLSIRETHGIVKTAEGAAVSGADGSLAPLDAESLVSMNFWGFTPDFIEELERGFVHFLDDLPGQELTAEYLLPTIVDGLLREHRVDLSVLPSQDHWFGVTYKEDVPFVREAFHALVEQGVYPKALFH